MRSTQFSQVCREQTGLEQFFQQKAAEIILNSKEILSIILKNIYCEIILILKFFKCYTVFKN